MDLLVDLFYALILEGELRGFILYVDPGRGVTVRGFILYVDPGWGVTWIYFIP